MTPRERQILDAAVRRIDEQTERRFVDYHRGQWDDYGARTEAVRIVLAPIVRAEYRRLLAERGDGGER